MKIKIFLKVLVIQAGLTSCVEKDFESNQIEYYSIERFNKEYFEDSTRNIAFDHYQKHNIIFLESIDELIYHDLYFSCGTGWTPYDPPRPVNFSENDFLVFDSIEGIVKRIRGTENTPRLVMMIADTDTIWDQRYFALKKELELIDDCYLVGTRKVTKDELKGIESLGLID